MNQNPALHGKNRPCIPSDKGKECFTLSSEGYGYKKAAKLSGLNIYTAREYRRRFNSGNYSWVVRGGSSSVD